MVGTNVIRRWGGRKGGNMKGPRLSATEKAAKLAPDSSRGKKRILPPNIKIASKGLKKRTKEQSPELK